MSQPVPPLDAATQDVVDILPMPVLLFAGPGRLQVANRAARDLLGEPLPDPAWCDRTLLASGGEAVIPISDGRRLPVHVQVRPWHGLTLLVLHDRRDELSLADRMRLAETRSRTEQLDAVARIVGLIAHDFNNHLTAIHGHAELLAALLPKTTRESSYAGTILQAAERATVQMRNLQAMARRDGGTAVIETSHLIEEAVAQLKLSVDARHRVTQRLASGLPPVRGDAAVLRGALVHLMNNAREAMPDGGDIQVAAAVVRLDAVTAQGLLATPAAGRFVRIDVHDGGPGLPPEAIRRIGEPGNGSRGPGRRAGMGLALVYAAMAAHRGGLAVEVRPGSGTSVAIYLPLPPESGTQTQRRASQPARLTARVLVCDDEPAVRGVLAESLRSLGCEVEAVGDGGEVLARWGAGRPYDLLVLDLLMPGMHGTEVFRELRRRHPQARVLFVSGHGGEVERSALMASGAVGFLGKPFTLVRLGEAVRQALG